MPKGTHAFGTTIKWNAKAVGGVNNIGGVELNTETIDVTTHDSPNGHREFIGGLTDTSEVPIDGYFDPADTNGQLAMLADAKAKAIREVIITFPTTPAATWTFNALITRIKVGDHPVDGAIPFSASLKISGEPAFIVGTGA